MSVIVPSYNHARFLGRCLENVLAQSFGDWELVLVDDGSRDGSLDVARSYADPRITCHSNEQNLGTYGTQNVGLGLAKGKWIAILNSDDYWEPAKLGRQLDLLERHPEAAFCYTLGTWVDERDDATRPPADASEEQHADWPRDEVQLILPYLLHENRILASSLLFRRGAVTFDASLRYSGDWVALLRLGQLGPAACAPEPLTHWRQHDANSYRQLEKTFLEEIRVRRSILNRIDHWLAAIHQREQAMTRLSRCAMDLCALYALGGDRAAARDSARLALRLDPGSRAARKRLLATFLPASVLRRRLWGALDGRRFTSLYRQAQVPPLDLSPGAIVGQ
ncbi:MAG TPA: glycosyltransferase [Fimbriimonadaceae bacterium]|nr:glycosyltransferase [Fimbriimonadaceae bacterium]